MPNELNNYYKMPLWVKLHVILQIEMKQLQKWPSIFLWTGSIKDHARSQRSDDYIIKTRNKGLLDILVTRRYWECKSWPPLGNFILFHIENLWRNLYYGMVRRKSKLGMFLNIYSTQIILVFRLRLDDHRRQKLIFYLRYP